MKILKFFKIVKTNICIYFFAILLDLLTFGEDLFDFLLIFYAFLLHLLAIAGEKGQICYYYFLFFFIFVLNKIKLMYRKARNAVVNISDITILPFISMLSFELNRREPKFAWVTGPFWFLVLFFQPCTTIFFYFLEYHYLFYIRPADPFYIDSALKFWASRCDVSLEVQGLNSIYQYKYMFGDEREYYIDMYFNYYVWEYNQFWYEWAKECVNDADDYLFDHYFFAMDHVMPYTKSITGIEGCAYDIWHHLMPLDSCGRYTMYFQIYALNCFLIFVVLDTLKMFYQTKNIIHDYERSSLYWYYVLAAWLGLLQSGVVFVGFTDLMFYNFLYYYWVHKYLGIDTLYKFNDRIVEYCITLLTLLNCIVQNCIYNYKSNMYHTFKRQLPDQLEFLEREVKRYLVKSLGIRL